MTIAKTKDFGIVPYIYLKQAAMLLTSVIMHVEAKPIQNTKYYLMERLSDDLCLDSRCFALNELPTVSY